MREGVLLNQRYRVLGLLGEGGMSTVYRAEDTALGRPVAIKVLREQLARDRAFLARFRDEARAAASLSHPNIVAIYDVGQDAGLHYIVMEYVDGPSLKDVVAREAPLPIDRATALAQQVLAALDAAHQRGIVHRDIKPQNVLLTRDGTAKVADFGIARQLAAAGQTQGGDVFGTAAYLAPERASGKEATAASDVYSAGVLLFEMLTGRLPFTGDSPVEVALKHVQEQPPPLHRFNPGVPAGLEAVVLRALAKDPSQRYGTAREMARALVEYERAATAVTTPLKVMGGAMAPVLAAPARAAARPVPDAPGRAPGFNWVIAILLVATITLIALLIPLGQLFYYGYLRPLLSPPPAATAAPPPQPTATLALTPTATLTATPSPTVSPTATPVPSATPTPQYPDWMRFVATKGPPMLVSGDKKDPSEVRGRIVDQAGNLVPGLRVRIESEGGWKAWRPRPNIDVADGTFRFDQLSPGRYRVTVVDKDDNPISQTADGLVTDNLPGNFKGFVIWEVTFKQVR